MSMESPSFGAFPAPWPSPPTAFALGVESLAPFAFADLSREFDRQFGPGEEENEEPLGALPLLSGGGSSASLPAPLGGGVPPPPPFDLDGLLGIQLPHGEGGV